MKHQKEWRTCDRCGKEIIRYDEKYALEKFGRLTQSHIEMNFARDSKIVEETKRFIRNENNKL